MYTESKNILLKLVSQLIVKLFRDFFLTLCIQFHSSRCFFTLIINVKLQRIVFHQYPLNIDINRTTHAVQEPEILPDVSRSPRNEILMFGEMKLCCTLHEIR